ncbi:hypothetical protein [Actinacidiphila soli]|uniref:hypothetical protein n=1 Tax=Actinacidiphila soli TaxID=2487275 RepID=UPI000FCAF225|nr:hypothetical protein [Actinacidiphila soli]
MGRAGNRRTPRDSLTRDALAVLQPGFTGTAALGWLLRRLGAAAAPKPSPAVADPRPSPRRRTRRP